MSCNCNNCNNYDDTSFFNNDSFGDFYPNSEVANRTGFNSNGNFSSNCPCNGDNGSFASTNFPYTNNSNSFASTNNTCNNQNHVHEFLGSTRYAQQNNATHNHRFAGVTSEAIPRGCSHVHEINAMTDFFDHYHLIRVCTGPAIDVGNGRHVHFVKGVTTCENGHSHEFMFATLIESPTL